ncbi:MAG: XRE family transcriptional regulator [Proteobacteria bacterium]|nr:XRE family transcriptional regulator [Pseudomonadota bacterium]
MKKTKTTELAAKLKISRSRALEAVIKAQLIAAVAKIAKKNGLTHELLAERSGLPRSAVTGILAGSMQKVTINRVLRLVEAAGLVAEVKVKEAA